jgi:3-oxoacyl-[acyl-carrier protein] reductase
MSTADKSLISLAGKTALVTGGSRGIGRAICTTLSRSGAFVGIGFRGSEAAAVETLTAIHQEGGDGELYRIDVRDPSSVDAVIHNLLSDREAINIVVNNAGVTHDGLLGRMKDDQWSEVLQVNLSGAFHVCRAVSKHMIRSRGGRIVNVASTAGEAGNAGQGNYSAAKAGLIGLTKALARELAPRNILVNCVSPGIIRGGMTERLSGGQRETILGHVPLGREGDPFDVAAAVLFLCSDMASYVTGQVLRVNGGLYM